MIHVSLREFGCPKRLGLKRKKGLILLTERGGEKRSLPRRSRTRTHSLLPCLEAWGRERERLIHVKWAWPFLFWFLTTGETRAITREPRGGTAHPFMTKERKGPSEVLQADERRSSLSGKPSLKKDPTHARKNLDAPSGGRVLTKDLGFISA